MKKYIIFLLFFSFTSLLAQAPWSYSNFFNSHVVLFQPASIITIDGNPISCGDYIGVFYEDNGLLVCAGYLEWTGESPSAINVYGDDFMTIYRDGFLANEILQWKVWQASSGLEIEMTPVYFSNFNDQGVFVPNGMSGISFLTGESPNVPGTQTIYCPENWSIFSTYLQPPLANIADVLNPINSNILIVKDWNGQTYWPGNMINNIGNIIPGQGYLIKMLDVDTLIIQGNIIQPDTIDVVLPANWSILGYLRFTSAPIVDMLLPINNNLVLIKDWNGQAYWPDYGVDQIGDMLPGYGYPINMITQDTLVYQPNSKIPTVVTISVSDITDTSAISGGEVILNGGTEVIVRGVCWNTTGSPTIADFFTSDSIGLGAFISSLSDLTSNTTYYLKAYATNEVGTAYGSEMQFVHSSSNSYCTPTLTDYDGNIYSTILIGNQCWMSENLATTHYANGNPIPFVSNDSIWGSLGNNNTDDAYGWYNNDINNKYLYGALYTWAAAIGNTVGSNLNPSEIQGVCPTGWHMPSDNEWIQLEMQLGLSYSQANSYGSRGENQGSQLAGNSQLWNNGNLINSAQFGVTGFSALPGGHRNLLFGWFQYCGERGYWWSSSSFDGGMAAYYRQLDFNSLAVFRSVEYKLNGFSVRCLKD